MSDLSPLPTKGRAYRERLHAALIDHPRLAPEALLDALAEKVEDDPIGVLRAISATLPKEAELATMPQQNHLHLVRIVGAAQERGIDLQKLLEPVGGEQFPPAGAVPVLVEEGKGGQAPAAVAAADEDWLR